MIEAEISQEEYRYQCGKGLYNCKANTDFGAWCAHERDQNTISNRGLIPFASKHPRADYNHYRTNIKQNIKFDYKVYYRSIFVLDSYLLTMIEGKVSAYYRILLIELKSCHANDYDAKGKQRAPSSDKMYRELRSS